MRACTLARHLGVHELSGVRGALVVLQDILQGAEDPRTRPIVLLYLQRARESVLDASENAEGARSAPRGTKASSYAKINVPIFTLKRRHGRTTWRLLFLAVQ